ncbi:polysaccharide biosynthesis protein [Mesomycoplasma bovoculi]|uniref:Transmembrane protein n=1 Tax=Mesomycoplasma bovoculi M165/69 TaxID=743966 RepID=W5USY6_9BACT|nr:hypothetical protein [Mesomycoplasma bovoculi]AHH45236.1 hypothetical protein MYB_01125 [Mesomycoplasma bovoculi M165/69]
MKFQFKKFKNILKKEEDSANKLNEFSPKVEEKQSEIQIEEIETIEKPNNHFKANLNFLLSDDNEPQSKVHQDLNKVNNIIAPPTQTIIEAKTIDKPVDQSSPKEEPVKKNKFIFWPKKKTTSELEGLGIPKEERQLVEDLSQIQSIEALTEFNEKMDYRSKINVWSNNFKVLNKDILSNLESVKSNDKNNPIETFWNKMSILAQSIYKTIVILLVSLIWFLFWAATGGFDKYSVWQYSVYILSLTLFLFFVELMIYINNVQNKGHSDRLVRYYVNNGIITLINYAVRILFLFTPLFVQSFIQVSANDSNSYKLVGILSVATSAPSLSLFFASIFYVPVHWNKIYKKIIVSTGILHIFSHLYLLKNYKHKQTDLVYKRLRDNWIRLHKTYGKPLGIGYHPEFIKTITFMKNNPDLSNEEQKRLIERVKNIIQQDLHLKK